MSLPWVRLETGFAHNPKILDLVARRKHQAINLYVFALGYVGAHGLDGYVPPTALVVIHGTPALARELVDAGLWRACEAGWEINGWTEYQYTSEENARRTERAKTAAEARWRKQRDGRLRAIKPSDA